MRSPQPSLSSLTPHHLHIASIISKLVDTPKIDRPLTTPKEFRWTICRLFCQELLREDQGFDAKGFYEACGVRITTYDRQSWAVARTHSIRQGLK